jgi:hypothetical protein
LRLADKRVRHRLLDGLADIRRRVLAQVPLGTGFEGKLRTR